MEKQINIPKVFFGFLLASFLMWLLINLSKEYSSAITYELEYEELAQNKVLQEEPLKKIDLQVKGTGFKLLSENFSNRKLKLSADKLSKKSRNHYYFIPAIQKNDIQEQLRSGLKLEEVLQDTIYLQLGSLQSKKVPVLTDLSIQYQVGFDLAAPIQSIPDSVLVSGPELQLSKLNHVTTNHFEVEEVSEDIEKELSIVLPIDSDKIKASHSKVTVKVLVDKFTEGEFELPVEVVNAPLNINLNTFPKKVKVVYKVGLKDFNKITAESFKVVCDYKISKAKELNYMTPRLMAKPDIVSSVRIVPDKIDFLIQK